MRRLMVLAAVFAGVVASAQQPLPIRSMGDSEMRGTLKQWEVAYQRLHPTVHFDDKLWGTATGMAGITTGASDITLLGRPVTANEVIGFEWVHRVKPLGLEIARGPLWGEGKSPALAVMVSRRNPIKALTLAQLAAVLGCPTDASRQVTWAMLGATGVWATRPVHAYLFDDQTGTGVFLQRTVQGSKDCWNWSIVQEFKDKPGNPAANQIVAALRKDRDGLAVGTMTSAGVAARVVSVDGIQPTTQTLIDGSYPFGRGIYVYIDPATLKSDKIVNFLRFCLSQDGQKVLAAQGDFLPLDTSTAAHELTKLQ